MLETSANPIARRAVEIAHKERAQAFASLWTWMLPNKASR